jgi:hypothetical protein
MTYTVMDAFKDTVTGKAEFVVNVIREQRLITCSNCSEFRKMSRQCSLCGCFMDVKARYKHATCPQGKW